MGSLLSYVSLHYACCCNKKKEKKKLLGKNFSKVDR